MYNLAQLYILGITCNGLHSGMISSGFGRSCRACIMIPNLRTLNEIIWYPCKRRYTRGCNRRTGKPVVGVIRYNFAGRYLQVWKISITCMRLTRRSQHPSSEGPYPGLHYKLVRVCHPPDSAVLALHVDNLHHLNMQRTSFTVISYFTIFSFFGWVHPAKPARSASLLLGSWKSGKLCKFLWFVVLV